MEKLASVNFNMPELPIPPSAPSPFELGVATELEGLAENLRQGFMHVLHFSLTIQSDGSQKMGIEVE